MANMVTHGHLLYNNLIVECRYLIKRLNAPKLVHTFREQNRVANVLAKKGMQNVVFDIPTILQVPPMCAQQAFQAYILRRKNYVN